ncbi:MAG: calcium/sodium antiporter [Firmicutes bacterium]|nr:calcium/sodium antiporter [Bacillota bacterium]
MNYILLAIGLVVLVKGADLLVGGASKIAKILKVPAFIVGLIIVALGTSAPESTIGIISGIKGTNILTLGDVIGSNIVNIAIVMGLTAMVVPLTIDSLVAKRELPISLFVQGLLLVMLITGGVLSRFEGIILLLGMLIFLVFIVSKSRAVLKKELPDTDFEEDVFEYLEDQKVFTQGKGRVRKKELPKAIVYFILGLVALIGGAQLVVDNAVFIANSIGLSEEFIGITIIAFGTSLPELVTCLTAVIKKEDDIAIGNIIGSNIINILFVLGLSSMIHPIIIGIDTLVDVMAMLFFTIILMVPTLLQGKITRRWGFLMFGLYVIFLAYKISVLV